MDKKIVEQHLFDAQVKIDAALLELHKPDDQPDEPDPPTEMDCARLVEALNAAGAVKLGKRLACSTPTFFSVKGNTQLYGNFSALHGGVYAIRVIPGQNVGRIQDVTLTTDGLDCVVNLGVNDTSQNKLELVPTDWVLEGINISKYTGKRGIAVNSAKTTIRNSNITGVVHPNHQDSQAICVLNSPGELLVEQSTLSAAAECILIGGDNSKLPVLRRNIKLISCDFFKDIAWKAAGVPTKNLVELKDGWDVLIKDCKLHTCWASAQEGEAYMFTPSNGGQVSVIVMNNDVSNVSSICNITGVDAKFINKVRSQVSFIGGTYKTNSAVMGGRGNFALLDRGPEFLKITQCDITIDGSTFVELTGTAKMDLLEITNSRFNYGKYGIRIGGLNDGDNSKGMIGAVRIEGNTILGANSRFKTRYPNNTYA